MKLNLQKIAQEAFQDELQTITNNTVPKLAPAKLNRTISELPGGDGSEETSTQPIAY
jgi:hypothetical protein